MAKLNGDQIVALMAKGEVKRIQELKTISQNGENIGPDEGYDAFYKVTVDVATPVLQEKTVTENGEVIPDEGYNGLSKVTVNVPTYITVAAEEELPYDVPDGTIAVISEE